MPDIDPKRCLAPRVDKDIGGERCQEIATHETYLGRRCERHAEQMRRELRNPNILFNVLAGRRARTEDEIEKMVVRLKTVAKLDS